MCSLAVSAPTLTWLDQTPLSPSPTMSSSEESSSSESDSIFEESHEGLEGVVFLATHALIVFSDDDNGRSNHKCVAARKWFFGFGRCDVLCDSRMCFLHFELLENCD
jgi:hypothetical protein